MATTKKKNKPKCTKGTSCGYSCIGAGKVCKQPVAKETVKEAIAGTPLAEKGSKGKAKGDKVKMKVKFLYQGDEKNPIYTDGGSQLDKADERKSYKTQAQIDNIVSRNKERGLDIKVGEKVVEVDKDEADSFKKRYDAEDVEGKLTEKKTPKERKPKYYIGEEDNETNNVKPAKIEVKIEKPKMKTAKTEAEKQEAFESDFYETYKTRRRLEATTRITVVNDLNDLQKDMEKQGVSKKEFDKRIEGLKKKGKLSLVNGRDGIILTNWVE